VRVCAQTIFSQLGDARPAIVHTTLMLLHHVLSLCAEKEDANSAMKGMRIEIVPALLAAASGGQTECRVMLANNTCYSVRDGSLATSAMLCTSYIDGSTVKDLLAPISSTVKEQSETEGVVVPNLACFTEVMALLSRNSGFGKLAKEMLQALVQTRIIIRSHIVRDAVARCLGELHKKLPKMATAVKEKIDPNNVALVKALVASI